MILLYELSGEIAKIGYLLSSDVNPDPFGFQINFAP